MAVKSIIGIIILALNLAGVCYMTIMILADLRKKSANNPMIFDKGMERKKSESKTKQTSDTMDFNKADYLLDDIDLSEFDDLDLDYNQNNDGEKLDE